ncbi:MAG: TRAP transporter fused permease subunit, partial [Pseudomonadota bacterium]
MAGRLSFVLATACVLFAAWHLYVLNIAPLETWTFRIAHVAGSLALGVLLSGAIYRGGETHSTALVGRFLGFAALAITVISAVLLAYAGILIDQGVPATELPPWAFGWFGPLLAAGVVVALVSGWIRPVGHGRIGVADWTLALAAILVGAYMLVGLDALAIRLRAGTPFADPANAWAALVGVVLILEVTRRLAGLPLVIIAAVFILYSFVGPWLPGFLQHSGYTWSRFFTYIYTDNGILGPTTAVSSTYIILFIIFASFLQVTRVGQYFVDFSFALAGRARGGPAKVAVFASGLMGTINGTSAGNVVATGSITIPLMKSVGYKPKTAAAIEATASTGGQIMPPIMGAGAFIMAEITGIPYTEIVVAAIIPAVLYFIAIYLKVDLEAVRSGMKGLPGDQLPTLGSLLRRAYLFAPMAILIYALFAGYSVVRAGTLAIAAAAVVSWLTPHRMGPRQLFRALGLSTTMSLQIIAVCAAAGIIVGVISLTGVGARFSALLLDLAQASTLLALVFAMIISIILGMGMPTTAAYAVAASVVAPGLTELGVEPLVAHFFVFYFAVLSAVTPPVALAAYAGSAIAGSDPMKTSVESFRYALTAFIVPFVFF